MTYNISKDKNVLLKAWKDCEEDIEAKRKIAGLTEQKKEKSAKRIAASEKYKAKERGTKRKDRRYG